jgi:FAD/FMN-containing dehydrogenase
MENMGDIDRQAIGGAVATGTHGAGRMLGSISTQVVGLRLATATGDLLDLDGQTDGDLLKAAQVSLGALGVITRVTLRLLPAFWLHERTWVADFDECMAELDTHIAANRHFEFFWSPGEDGCAMKTLNPVAPATPPSEAKPVVGRLARYVREERIDASHRIFPSERTLRFTESEFALPAEQGPACLREIRRLMRSRHNDIIWPIEYRTLAADDIYLSPAYGRATVTISVHQAAELPYHDFFADVEAIFRNHRGRPHWGKIHTHMARELRALYPMWDRFQVVRRRLDPNGVFLNEHLHRLFED